MQEPIPTRMPAEWEPHERCLMAWPVPGTDRETWWGLIEDARREYAEVARAIARFEPVLMVAAPGCGSQASAMCGPDVEVIELPIDDSWMRDSGPIFAFRPGHDDPVALDFRFNAWGERGPFELDDQVSGRLSEHLNVECERLEMVLEGGSITVDGEGTLITTEQCLLNPNRNPEMSRDEIERTLSDALGLTRVVWLPVGGSAVSVTDGHVDGVCAFAAPGVVVAQSTQDPAHPSYDRLQRNLRALRAARDAGGRSLEVIEIPHLPLIASPRGDVPVLPVNFYVANGGVIVPTPGLQSDRECLEAVASAFPGREVVAVPGRALAVGGGGVHCITQQQPRRSAA